MTRICIIMVAAAGALTACSQAQDPTTDLTKTCQVRECTCTETSGSFFDAPDSVDLLWRENGDAYCPPGHALRLVPPPPPKPGGIPLNPS